VQGEDDAVQDDSVEQEQDLEGRLKDLEKELQYAKAEIANVGQRAARDRAESLRYGGASLARRIIPIFDLLEKAVAVSDLEEGANESITGGVKLTLENLRISFEGEGITEIEALGKEFDPTCMEAIATIPCPDDKEPGTVVEVIESGFRMHERILRASKVVVAEGDS
tara:strand:+ start:134 stop:634 length:501 start_codon:yes stop_codon:yes gene_type:complete